MNRSHVSSLIYKSIADNDITLFGRLLDEYPEICRLPDGRENWLDDVTERGRLEFLKLLVSRGADINESTSGDTSLGPEGILDTAANEGHLEIVKWLLDQGAILNHTVNGQVRCFALTGAISSGHLDVVKLLLDRGAAINNTWADTTPLDFAHMYGEAEIAEYLRSQGAKTFEELSHG